MKNSQKFFLFRKNTENLRLQDPSISIRTENDFIAHGRLQGDSAEPVNHVFLNILKILFNYDEAAELPFAFYCGEWRYFYLRMYRKNDIGAGFIGPVTCKY